MNKLNPHRFPLRKRALATALLCLIGGVQTAAMAADKAPPPTATAQIDALVNLQMADDKLPGVTLAITRNGQVLHNKGYGVANTLTQQPMTANTRALIGSTTKVTITAAAGTELMEAKNIDPATQRLYGASGVFGFDFSTDIGRGVDRHTPLVEADIGVDNRTYAWYLNRTMSGGATNDLDKYSAPQPYTLPGSREPVDIRGIAIASNGKVYAWYDNARTSSTSSPKVTRSIGTLTNLGLYSAETEDAVSLPAGKTAFDIVGIAIAKSNDHVYVWYQDGTVSEGTSMDFDAYSPPKPFTAYPRLGGSSYDLRAVGIATNDRVYAWFGNSYASSGTSTHLAQYLTPYYYTMTPNLPNSDNWRQWYGTLTVQNLLDHRAGFTRSGDVAGAAEMFGKEESALTYKEVHRHFLRTRPLIGAPGTVASYSNHGFGLWTLLIEKMSGQPFRDYVHDHYLVPHGVASAVMPQGSAPGPLDSQNHVLNKQGIPVPGAYEPSTLGLAAGGYRATARALTVLTADLADKYTADQLDRMGWAKTSDGRLQHNGALTGGMSYVVMYPPGYKTSEGLDLGNVHVAVVANRRGSTSELAVLASLVAEEIAQP